METLMTEVHNAYSTRRKATLDAEPVRTIPIVNIVRVKGLSLWDATELSGCFLMLGSLVLFFGSRRKPGLRTGVAASSSTGTARRRRVRRPVDASSSDGSIERPSPTMALPL